MRIFGSNEHCCKGIISGLQWGRVRVDRVLGGSRTNSGFPVSYFISLLASGCGTKRLKTTGLDSSATFFCHPVVYFLMTQSSALMEGWPPRYVPWPIQLRSKGLPANFLRYHPQLPAGIIGLLSFVLKDHLSLSIPATFPVHQSGHWRSQQTWLKFRIGRVCECDSPESLEEVSIASDFKVISSVKEIKVLATSASHIQTFQIAFILCPPGSHATLQHTLRQILNNIFLFWALKFQKSPLWCTEPAVVVQMCAWGKWIIVQRKWERDRLVGYDLNS